MRALNLLPWICVLTGCGGSNPLTLRYVFDPEDVPGSAATTVQTRILPTLPQRFVSVITDHTLDVGVRYSVACPDPSIVDCVPEMVIVHDAGLGFRFADDFALRFAANPQGSPDHVVISAVAFDGDGKPIAHAQQVESTFAGATVDVILHARERCGASLCEPSQRCCGTTCVDVSLSDANNCGACGARCNPSEICGAGSCRCGDQPGCRGGQTCCDGKLCADTMNDPMSCGACGKVCGAGESCVGGVCHCGSGDPCGAGMRCCGSEGSCVAANAPCPCGTGPSCDTTQTCCGGTSQDLGGGALACRTLGADPFNCGQCGRTCGPGFGCAGGACSCGSQSCGADCCSNSCIDLQTSKSNCGACGASCAANEDCVAGKCTCGASPDCAVGSFCCGTTSKACQAQNAQNCGGCNAACLSNETCPSGACVCPANGNQHCASGSCCSDGCHDLMADPNNCGACGKVCTGMGVGCVSGSCQQTSCAVDCATLGETCVGTMCRCGANPSCGTGLTCCGGTCVNTQTDQAHCHSCTVACGTGEMCSGGICKCGSGPGCGGPACVGGSCLQGNGSSCSSGGDCQSGYCAGPPGQSVCCSTPCPVPCRECSSGVCQFVGVGGQDPFGLCTPDGTDCGQTGVCGGNGQCQNQSYGNACCTGAQPGYCNGLGGCQPSGQTCASGCFDGHC